MSDKRDVVDIIDDVIADRLSGMSFEDLQHARDEIVALRDRLAVAQAYVIPNERMEARAEALEEAARCVEQGQGRFRRFSAQDSRGGRSI